MAGYAANTDMVARFSLATMSQLLPVAGSNPPTFDTARADVILGQVSNFMDSYIGVQYILPLNITPTPPQLVDCACDIAYYRMYSARPQNWTQDSRDRYDDALAYLKDIAAGRATLGTTVAQDATLAAKSEIGFSAPARVLVKGPNLPDNPIQNYLQNYMGPGNG